MALRSCVNLKFHLKVRNTQYNRNILQIKCIRFERNNVIQLYHSENGVYGYRPKEQEKHFEVSKEDLEIRYKNSNFYRLVMAYRQFAHKQADINPISLSKQMILPELQPKQFGLNLTDKVSFKGILKIKQKEGTLSEALKFLNDVYCSHIGVEFNHLETEEEREWFANTTEICLTESLDDKTRVAIVTEMLKSQAFDNFLAAKFVSLKRYSGEGAESMMAFFHEFFKMSLNTGLTDIVICMPHRGRLNFLTGILNFPPEKLFRKLKGSSEFPDDAKAIGDVASHLVSSTNLEIDNKSLHVTMLRNPSHLEAVNPVSMGKTRGIMQIVKDGAYGNDRTTWWSDKVLNLQIHGDAAYIGQGIDQECLALSNVPHFEIGGTIHLIINNQLGFTTPPSRGRSSRYCTDLGKMIAAPIIHVNGDEPEMVVRATRIAFKYQRKFKKDVFIDINCFRRWGHNELDDPTFTNPRIYKIIQNRSSVPDRYVEKLIKSNILTKAKKENIVKEHNKWLSEALKQVESYVPEASYFSGRWTGMKQAEPNITQWDTGIDIDLLRFIGERSVHVETNLNIHRQLLKTHIQGRLKKLMSGEKLDWATAEALAIGSLLHQGYNVRISGQDIGRGTFSHRHAMFADQNTGNIYIPLNSMADEQIGKLELANSILSEEAVLGYEYGISITVPTTLTIWEAQFGDFFNGAQIIIDTFVTSGEAKWMLSSGLTMLLPHGYDGAGAEHSSCRIERFLQLTNSNEDKVDGEDVNIQVVNPTTPAQYFHLLRRQMIRNFRKPLIVISPKILLRHANATSSLTDMKPGTSFKSVIGNDDEDISKINKVVLTSGKHYYALKDYKKTIGENNVAIIRLECLCPFPVQEIMEEIQKYNHAKVFIWSQEEPRNMGAWNFVKTRFENLCGRQLKYCGRPPMAAPAVGDGKLHQQEVEEVIRKPFLIKTF
ncbi:probable 2-oxoglutarate dehydrogenase E1 component DHKTD1 homolog, mitochondrial isoform X1 [Vespa mandarinia]|uniref:probable 2-oxoglutarate dehydrogenase E1 component DHKTD1 homolog, mitochondrial isoform X1 n=2 Tax=Vespa mandarinia TaxID=7446 RepID=UPI0016094A26|nr:probable 2-oxoglutarate dehydrogenase E1 component DHKTD1 homolog, mitochondrial isoform X1 [Vespa mandarinia]